MANQHRRKTSRRRAADDIMGSLRELADAISKCEPPTERFTVRTVGIPAPGNYSPTALRKLRIRLGMSQAVFAELLGVSRVWIQSWERGVREPSPLARRLLDTIEANPSAWLTTIHAKAS